MKPISLIKTTTTNYLRLKEEIEEEFVVFCGNIEGHHKLVRIFKPFLGVVAVLDFLDGPVDFSMDSDGIYSAKVQYKIYLIYENFKIIYPVYYRLEKIGTTIGFNSQLQNQFSSIYYENYIDKELESFTDHNTRNRGYSALLVAIQTGNVKKICLSISKFKELLENSEIEKMWKFIDETGYYGETDNLFKCKEK